MSPYQRGGVSRGRALSVARGRVTKRSRGVSRSVLKEQKVASSDLSLVDGAAGLSQKKVVRVDPKKPSETLNTEEEEVIDVPDSEENDWVVSWLTDLRRSDNLSTEEAEMLHGQPNRIVKFRPMTRMTRLWSRGL